MKCEDKISIQCDEAEIQALTETKSTIDFWKSPKGQDAMAHDLKELYRVALVRSIFLKHPWWHLFNRIKLRCSYWILKILVGLHRFFCRKGRGTRETN